MLVTLGLSFIFTVLNVATFFLPRVEELPLGMDEALVFFSSTIHALLDLLPWLNIVWTLCLLALAIKFLLFSWHWVRWFIELVRG